MDSKNSKPKFTEKYQIFHYTFLFDAYDIQNGSNDLIYKTTCRKSDVWAYEKEWRIVIANLNKVMPQELDCPNGKYVLDLKSNIKAFYLGAKASDNFKEAMIQFGMENNIAVYEMVLSSETYELEAKRMA